MLPTIDYVWVSSWLMVEKNLELVGHPSGFRSRGGGGNDKKDNSIYDDDDDVCDDDDDDDDYGDEPVVGCWTEGRGVEVVEWRRWDSSR